MKEISVQLNRMFYRSQYCLTFIGSRNLLQVFIWQVGRRWRRCHHLHQEHPITHRHRPPRSRGCRDSGAGGAQRSSGTRRVRQPLRRDPALAPLLRWRKWCASLDARNHILFPNNELIQEPLLHKTRKSLCPTRPPTRRPLNYPPMTRPRGPRVSTSCWDQKNRVLLIT